MLEKYVEEYLASPDACNLCLEELPMAEDLRSAIRNAALSVDRFGRRMSHQRRMPAAVLLNVAAQLVKREREIAAVTTFRDLHGLVEQICRPIRGAGELIIYDVAFRIGSFLQIEPDLVYLHAGTRKGARRLGVWGAVAEVSAFPDALHCLQPWQLEDFLCRYAKKVRAKPIGRRERVRRRGR